MKAMQVAPSLTEQVHRALLSEIAAGRLAPGARIVQEQLAQELGVSRQPVQQALALLRREGVLTDAPGRGLQVAPLDMQHVRHVFELRAVVEGLAFRQAAEHGAAEAAARGPQLVRAGRDAVARGAQAELAAADMAFHEFICALSGNPLLSPVLQTLWTQTQRVLGLALLRNGPPRDTWDRHAALLDAVAAGDGDAAERLARAHILEAAEFVICQLEQDSGLA